jgi:predicted DNA-binding ribbon-helix-helix protein
LSRIGKEGSEFLGDIGPMALRFRFMESTTASRRKSHQTTIRFSTELWARLEQAAATLDVSVAQFVRDAARSRLDAGAGDRQSDPASALSEELAVVREDAREQLQGSNAVWEQARLARIRAEKLRAQARTLCGPERSTGQEGGAA